MAIRKRKFERTSTLCSGQARALLFALLAGVLFACSAEDTTWAERELGVGHGDRELALGDEGADVEAATTYFQQRGYFESNALSAEFPRWRPVVGAPPHEPRLFGPELETAVKQFQVRAGMAGTGVIDAATRAQMREPRCGVPDSAGGTALPSMDTAFDTPEGLVDKFAVIDPVDWYADNTVTIFVSNPPNAMVDGNGNRWNQQKNILDAVIVSGFSVWGRILDQGHSHTGNASALSFQVVSTAALGEVDVYFCATATQAQCADFDFTVLASANRTRVRFNVGQLVDGDGDLVRNMVWDYATSVGYDLLSVTAHESGHSLGLDHSSVVNGATRPVMYPGLGIGAKSTTLRPDDFQAMAVSPYTGYVGVPGTTNDARDVGASSTNAQGRPETAWKVSATDAPGGGGFTVHRWQESSASWTSALANTGAVRIDVMGNVPWIVTSAGLVRERTGVTPQLPNGTDWIDRGDCNFIDIGVASNNVIWALGGSESGGNYDVFRYNGATGTACNSSTTGTTAGWLEVNDDNGDGIRLDVSPLDGSPWVVASNGNIFHRNGVSGNTARGSSWSTFGGKAGDISVGPDAFGTYGAVWIVGHSSQTDDSFLLNIQSAIIDEDSELEGAPGRNGWFRAVNPGNCFSISAGRNGYPWVIGGSRSVFRRSSVF